MFLLLKEIKKIVFHVEELVDQLNHVQLQSDLLIIMDVNLDMSQIKDYVGLVLQMLLFVQLEFIQIVLKDSS